MNDVCYGGKIINKCNLKFTIKWISYMLAKESYLTESGRQNIPRVHTLLYFVIFMIVLQMFTLS